MPILSIASGMAIAALAGSQSGQFAPEGTPRQYAPDRTFDLLHVQVRLNIDAERRGLSGVSRNTVRCLRSGTTELVFHAAPFLRMSAVKVDGRTVSAVRNKRDVIVRLSSPSVKGKRHDVVFVYAAPKLPSTPGFHWVQPTPGQPDRVGFWTQGETVSNSDWVPTWDYPNDFATSETITTVPAPWTVVGNGDLLSEVPSADRKRKTFHWRMNQPHVTYLISLVGGPLDVAKDSYRGKPLWYVVPKGFGKSVIAPSFSDTPAMLACFERRLGVPYPWTKYAQNTMFDFGGGMENVSASTLDFGALTDGRDGMRTMSALNAHELAHQWFGDLVTCKTWADIWLNESFATFLEAVYMQDSRGAVGYQDEIENFIKGYLEEAKRYIRPLSTNVYATDWAMFDSHSYPKGAAILHTFRNGLGEEAFWGGLRRYLNERRYQPSESANMEQALTEATGINVKPWFDQWIHKPGHPVLEASWSQGQVTVKQVQDVTKGVPIYDWPLEIGVFGDSQLRTMRVRLSKAEETYRISVPFPIRAVVLDPAHRMLREIRKPEWTETEALAVFRLSPSAADRREALGVLAKTVKSGPILREIIGRLRRDTGAYAAYSGYEGLNGPEIEEQATEDLRHADPRRRSAAAQAIADLPATPARIALMRRVGASEFYNEPVLIALRALRKWAPQGHADVFRAAARVRRHQEPVLPVALAALVTLKDDAGLKLTADLCTRKHPYAVRLAACRLVGKLADRPDAVRSIAEVLQQGDDALVQAVEQGLGAENPPALVTRLRSLDTERLRPSARAFVEKLLKRSVQR
jgi:aminopeptidase N